MLLECLSRGFSLDEAVSIGRRKVKADALLLDSWNPMVHATDPASVRFETGTSIDPREDAATEQNETPTDSRLDRYNNLSRSSVGLVARHEYVQPLINQLSFDEQEPVRIALAGMSGVGKTQIARLVASEAYETGLIENVLEIKAEESTLLATAFADLANHVPEITAGRSDEGTAKNVVRWLEDQPRKSWLLFYDNVPDFGAVKDFLPEGDIPVIITSRSSAWPVSRLKLQPVGPMTGDEGLELFMALFGVGAAEKEEAAGLVEELGGLPLAVAQAAAYMRRTRMHIAEYRELLEKHPERMLDLGETEEELAHERVDFRVMRVVLSSLDRLDAASLRLLRVCAWLDPDNVPDTLLAQEESLAHLDIGNSVDFREAIATLCDLWLIQGSAGRLAVHRLVQSIVRRIDVTDFGGEGRSLAAKCVGAAVVDSKSIRLSTQLASHLDVLSRHLLAANGAGQGPDAVPADEPESIELMVLAAEYHRSQTANTSLADELALAALNRSTGRPELESMALMKRFQVTAFIRSRSEAAIELGGRAGLLAVQLGDSEYKPWCLVQSIQEAVLNNDPVSEDAVDLARSESARLQPAGGRTRTATLLELAEALRTLHRQVPMLEILQELRAELIETGFEREIASTLMRMATARSALGQYFVSVELVRESLEMLAAGGELVSPDAARCLNNLSWYLYNVGDLEEALDAINRAVEHERRLSPDSPTLANRLGNLAMTLSALEQFDAARERGRESVQILRAGEPSRWSRLRQLGEVLLVRHRVLPEAAASSEALAEALDVLEEAYSLRPGPDQLQEGQMNLLALLAMARFENGDRDGARELIEEARSTYGPHLLPTSLGWPRLALAEARLTTADAEQKVDFLLEAIRLSEAAAGPRCPLVTEALAGLAEVQASSVKARDEIARLELAKSVPRA